MNEETPKLKRESPKYWFPAKRYGWGWGFPATWQGWTAFSLFIFVSAASQWLADGSIGIAISISVLAATALIAVCFWKGEPPKWRWGDRAEKD